MTPPTSISNSTSTSNRPAGSGSSVGAGSGAGGGAADVNTADSSRNDELSGLEREVLEEYGRLLGNIHRVSHYHHHHHHHCFYAFLGSVSFCH